MKTWLRALVPILLATSLSVGQQTPPDPAAPTFRSQSDLVIVPFHVARAGHYVSDLKPADVVLLEDGHPRDFSVFEGPARRQTPLELVLLFDTTSWPMGLGWNLKEIYDFSNHWDAARSEAAGALVPLDQRAERIS